MREGLDRHDGIHAIASALAERMWSAVREPPAGHDLPEAYCQALEELSASTWLRTL